MAWPKGQSRAVYNAQRTATGAPQGDSIMAETTTTTGAPMPTGTITLTQEQFDTLLQSRGTGSGSALDIAKAFATTQTRDNPNFPDRSMANPLGEREHPRPSFVAKKITQNGVVLDRELLTIEEIEALNALRPGAYRVERANGTQTPFTVNDLKGFDGTTIERREIHFPCKDENQADHKSLYDYCLDVLTQSGQSKDVERLRSLRMELNTLRKAG